MAPAMGSARRPLRSSFEIANSAASPLANATAMMAPTGVVFARTKSTAASGKYVLCRVEKIAQNKNINSHTSPYIRQITQYSNNGKYPKQNSSLCVLLKGE